jgi:hypothetical protein
MDTGEFVRMTEARKRLGLSGPTILDRVRRSGIPVYDDPRDRRAKLVRLADLETLLTRPPAPINQEAARGDSAA